jgi:hypothetical protein
MVSSREVTDKWTKIMLHLNQRPYQSNVPISPTRPYQSNLVSLFKTSDGVFGE